MIFKTLRSIIIKVRSWWPDIFHKNLKRFENEASSTFWERSVLILTLFNDFLSFLKIHSLMDLVYKILTFKGIFSYLRNIFQTSFMNDLLKNWKFMLIKVMWESIFVAFIILSLSSHWQKNSKVYWVHSFQ